jgi:hypothetical protein
MGRGALFSSSSHSRACAWIRGRFFPVPQCSPRFGKWWAGTFT